MGANIEATPTTPHPTGDVAALRALALFSNDAGLRNVGDRVEADDEDLARVVTDADLLHELFRPTPSGRFAPECVERLLSALRTQLAGADATAAPGSDGGVDAMPLPAHVFGDANTPLSRTSYAAATPATGGAARLDREAADVDEGLVAQLIKAYREARANFGGTSDEATKTRHHLYDLEELCRKLALDPDPQPQAASEGVREAPHDTSRMAEGCCSACSPCSHQKRDPYSICDVCQKAAAIGAERERMSEHQRTVAKAAAERAGKNASVAPELLFAPILWALQDAAITPAARGADAGGWRPIETAPKDGTHVLVAQFGAKPIRAWYQNDRWWMHGCGPYDHRPADLTGDHGPTLWQPLPAAPTAPGEA